MWLRSVSGVSNYTSPKFASFTEDEASIMTDLFAPPSGYWLFIPFSYEKVVLYAIIVCLLLLPLAPGTLAGIWFIVPRSKEKSDAASESTSSSSQHGAPGILRRAYAKLRMWLGNPWSQAVVSQQEDWKPWTFGIAYLASLSIATASLIALLALLLWRSEQFDPLVERKL